jgi:hypothetical protein
MERRLRSGREFGILSAVSRRFQKRAGWGWAIVLLLLPAAVLAGDFTYSTNADDTITITMYTGLGGEVQIPERFEERVVAGIKDWAFYLYTNSVSVVVPAGITNIGSLAFHNSPGLTAIHVVGSNMVYCSADGVLFSKAQPELIQYPGGKTGEYVVPVGVTQIKSNAFAFCGGLTRIEIGSSVTNIGMRALSPCTNLTEIAVDADNLFYSSADGVLFDQEQSTLIQCPAGKMGSYAIPAGVIGIGPDAFAFCGFNAIHFSASVAEIGAQPFYQCDQLEDITVDESNAVFSCQDGVLFDNNGLRLLFCPIGKGGTRVVPGGVTDIGASAFAFYSNLTRLVVAGSVTNISSQAFWQCGNLEKIYFKGDAPQVMFGAFFGVSFSATAYYLPGAFGWGPMLDSCHTAPWRSEEGFDLRVHADDSTALSITDYNGPGGEVVIPAHLEFLEEKTVSDIGFQAFKNTDITSVGISDSVTNIGDQAFELCSFLTNAVIGNGVLNIGNDAFIGCSALACVDMGTQVVSIGDRAFQFSGLKRLTLPHGLTHIGDSAFYDCYLLQNLVIPDSVTNMGNSAFFGCGITNAMAGSGLANIGNSMFAGCVNLRQVTITAGVTNLGNGAFHDCPGLDGVYFQGDAPTTGTAVFAPYFTPTIYYLPGAQEWPTVPDLWAGCPTALWLPEAMDDGSLGVQGDQFGFNIGWAAGKTVVVDACTNLIHPVWVPVGTNTLGDGSVYFGDSEWTNHVGRYYRLREP